MGHDEIEFLYELLCSSLQEMENILTLPPGSAAEHSDKEGKFWSHNACLGSQPTSATKQQWHRGYLLKLFWTLVSSLENVAMGNEWAPT